MVVRFLFAKLWREVVRCTHDCMSKVGSLVEHLGHSQISNLDLVILSEEHIDGLNITMQNLVCVEVLHAQTHLHEELPNARFPKLATHLTLQVKTQVSILTVLHDDVNRCLLSEGIVELHNIGTVDLGEDSCL